MAKNTKMSPVWHPRALVAAGAFPLLVLAGFALLLSGCLGQGGLTVNSASAKVVKDAGDLIGGPAASGRVGDILISNHKVRFIIQDTGSGKNFVREQAMSPYGGNVVDADVVRQPGVAGQDVMGEIGLFFNLGRTARYTTVKVVDDGSLDGTAVVEARGRGVTLTNLNVNTAVDSFAGGIGSALLGDFDPDLNYNLSIVTQYILRADAEHLEIRTVFNNTGGSVATILPGDIIDSGGAVEPFFVAGSGVLDTRHASRGFGEQPDDLGANKVELLAFRGKDISYGYIPLLPGQTVGNGMTVCALLVGVGVCNLGAEITLGGLRSVAIDGFSSLPEFTDTAFADVKGDFLPVPAGGSAAFRRFIAVGSSSISSLTDQLEDLYQEEWTTLSGSALMGGQGLAGVDVSIMKIVAGDLEPFTAVRSDDDGQFSVRLPVGSYVVLPNKEGYAFPDPAYYGGGTKANRQVKITADDKGDPIVLKPFVFAAPSTLKIFVQDDQKNPVPSRIFVFGNDTSPDAIISGGGAFDLFPTNPTGSSDLIFPFRDMNTDPMPHAGATDVTLTDWEGDTAVVGKVQYATFTNLEGEVSLPVEPGTWTVVATHGLEFDYDLVTLKVTAGRDAVASLRVQRAIDSYAWMGGDLHVHAINSPDAPTDNKDRILSFLADGVDFLVSTDHGFRTDFTPVIAGLEGDWDKDGKPDIKASEILVSIVGEEVTTWDHGHFNAFPLVADKDTSRHPESLPEKGENDYESAKAPSTTGGSTVWWQDDIAGGSGVVSTATEIFAALRADAPAERSADQVIQVNHPFGGDFQAHYDIIGLDFDFSETYRSTGDPAKPVNKAIIETLSGADRVADRSERRLPVLEANDSYIGHDLDALEILNGTNLDALWKGMVYWFGFLNVGKPVVATGNSDTHDLTKLASGVPRNYVRSKSFVDRASGLDDTVPLTLGIKKGQSFFSSGFFVEVTASLVVTNSTGIVSTQHDLSPQLLPYVATAGEGGISPQKAAAGYGMHVTLYVDVQAPRWAKPSRIDVFSNTPFIHQDDIKDSSWKTYDKFLSANAAMTWVLPQNPGSAEFWEETGFTYSFSDEITQFTAGNRYVVRKVFTMPPVTGVTELSYDRWYVVRVMGDKSGFPVLFHENEDVLPVSVVNPIRIDIDGLDWNSPCREDVPLNCRRN